MKEINNDMELKKLVKETRLEKPGNDFTLKVMNRIFDEETAKILNKGIKVLGKNFWVFVLLFVALGITMIILSATGVISGDSSTLLPEASKTITREYQTIFEKIGKVPLSIGAILTASSILLLIERFMSKKNLFS
ncbi:MAG: hypothetical protein JXR31_04170 [Prolixibacteraceae bacterium]|nr:hypothetical protein [Prolixibacteraceae bacterium]MBN2773419.1 hypothetical protein [Prolixibacteraceae bacterium]